MLLQRAYDVAETAHSGQKRKSGDPYITHPLAVATILAGLGMDTTTLVAALLHDTVEDTGATRDDHRRLRLRGHPPGRRRHEDRQGQAGRRGPGRDHPQDDRRDGPRPPRAGHQARRPAAQHAHPALPAAREAGDEGARDAGDPRPAGPPAGYEHDQVGASRTLRSPRCTRSATTRSSGWWPSAPRRGTPTSPRSPRRSTSSSRPRRSTRSCPAGPSTTTRSTRR